MAELTFYESYRAHDFVLEIEGTQCPVTKVSGLTRATDTIDQPDGGSARRQDRRGESSSTR